MFVLIMMELYVEESIYFEYVKIKKNGIQGL